MSNNPDFVTHALDLVSLLGPVQARAMFGGHGLYARGVMFGLLDDDELFLKTDDVSRGRFEEVGCRCWVYPSKNGPMETGYFRPPDEAHEDPEAMLPWARLALDAALRKAAAKAAKAMKPRGKRAAAGASRAAPGRRKAPPRRRAGRQKTR